MVSSFAFFPSFLMMNILSFVAKKAQFDNFNFVLREEAALRAATLLHY
jgi:hypothetical protein